MQHTNKNYVGLIRHIKLGKNSENLLIIETNRCALLSTVLYTVLKECPYFEEVLGRSGVDGAVLDVGLFREVLGRLDWRLHSFSRQKRSQVGRIRRYENQREEPPDAADYATRH